MCTNGIRGRVSIDALDQYPRSTSRSILDRHFIDTSVDTPSTSRSTVDYFRHSADYQPTVDQVPFECRPRLDRDVDREPIEMLIEGIDRYAFSTHDPVELGLKLVRFIRNKQNDLDVKNKISSNRQNRRRL